MKGNLLDLHRQSSQMSQTYTHQHLHRHIPTDRQIHVSIPPFRQARMFRYTHTPHICHMHPLQINKCIHMYPHAHTHTGLSYLCQRPLEMPAKSSSQQQGVAFAFPQVPQVTDGKMKAGAGERGETKGKREERARENVK